jgi:glycosyltransferase involved in cell wall biosynthesis
MRIVITRRFALDVRDGINIFIFSLAEALLRTGHEVTVVSTRVGDRDRISGAFEIETWPELIEMERGPTRLSYDGLTPRWLRDGPRVIARLRPDLVLNNGALPFRVKGLSVNLAHDMGWATSRRRMNSLRTAYKRYAYARCDRIVALSTEVRTALAAQLEMPVGRISYIPPSVELPRYEAARAAARQDVIAHTGTDDYKDPAAAIRAFAALRRPATRLLVEGAVSPELERQVAELPSETRRRIELLGALPGKQIRELLGSARIASFPTRYVVPTASATVVEAIATATPIVGSTSVSSDLLAHDQNGIACADDAALTAGFERLLDDDEVWTAMSEAAVQRARLHAADVVGPAYLSVFETAAA